MTYIHCVNKPLKQSYKPYGIVQVAILLRNIWTKKNEKIFDNFFKSPTMVAQEAWRKYDNYISVSHNKMSPSIQLSRANLRWIPT